MFHSGTPSPAATLSNRLVRLLGVVAMIAFLPGYRLSDLGFPVLAGTGFAIGGMLIWALAPGDQVRANHVALVLMAVCGGLTVAQCGGSAVATLAAVYAGFALVQLSNTFGVLIAAGATAMVSVSYLLAHARLVAYLGILAAIALVALMGFSRRQFRATAEQNRLLLQQSRQIRAERDRAATLAERGRIAREVHDVLAHTLGGLLLQLDAADALLEAGKIEQAADHVRSSRALAVAGLADARQVVGALRAERIVLSTELERLAREHRAAGGRVQLHYAGSADHLDEQVSTALLRGAQESLTNARKHAPGTEVEMRLLLDSERVELTASNPLPRRTGLLSATAPSAADTTPHLAGAERAAEISGSGAAVSNSVAADLVGIGAGLLGMRERIGALGGTVAVGKAGGRWVVRMMVPRR
ncbi:sensor histidine kinase [Nocardia sp. R16R-3T]